MAELSQTRPGGGVDANAESGLREGRKNGTAAEIEAGRTRRRQEPRVTGWETPFGTRGQGRAMTIWREWFDRVQDRLRRLAVRHPTGMPAPEPWSEPPEPPLGPDLTAAAPSVDWEAGHVRAALSGADPADADREDAPWTDAPPALVALRARAEASPRFREASAEQRRSPAVVLIGALHMIAFGRVPPFDSGSPWMPDRLFAALGLRWSDFAKAPPEPEAPPPLGGLLLELAPRLDWTDPTLRSGLVDPVWTPPPTLRAVIDRTREHPGQFGLHELAVSLPAHTLVLGCLALLRSLDDPAVGDLPCPAAGGRVGDFPPAVQTAMFQVFALRWPPTTVGAPVGFVGAAPSTSAAPASETAISPISVAESGTTGQPQTTPWP